MRVSVPIPALDADLLSSLGRLFRDVPGTFWASTDVRSEAWDEALLDPAREILSRTGKGLRARMLGRSWELAGGGPEGPPELLATVIELIHVGSLVIDDIEDDSRLRRGRPALHRLYGLPLALNTGNWLYFVALAALSRCGLPADVRLALFEDVSISLMRCHQGQALDLSVTVTATRRTDVPGVVATSTRLKTGSLMQLASVLGARATGAADQVVRTIGAFGEELGVGVQMLDDWSGVNVESRREKGREDVRLSRPTWPWAWLAAEADEVTYRELIRQARGISIDWDADRVVDRLRTLLAPVAPLAIRDQLEGGLDGLRSELPPRTDLEGVRADVAALERAFG